MCRKIYYDFFKSSVTLSDLKKIKRPMIGRIVLSSISNFGYLDIYFDNVHLHTRNYHINQLIYFLSTNILF